MVISLGGAKVASVEFWYCCHGNEHSFVCGQWMRLRKLECTSKLSVECSFKDAVSRTTLTLIQEWPFYLFSFYVLSSSNFSSLLDRVPISHPICFGKNNPLLGCCRWKHPESIINLSYEIILHYLPRITHRTFWPFYFIQNQTGNTDPNSMPLPAINHLMSILIPERKLIGVQE